MIGSPASAPSTTIPLAEQGYVRLEGFLTLTEVVELRELVGRILSAPQGLACERPHNTLVPLRWNDPPVTRVLDSPARATRLAAAIDATDLRWISGYVSVKEPHSAALWWHQDWWCWDHPVSYLPAAPQVALLCYLTDTDERNAALRVLPGSHHASTALHALLPEAHAAEADGLGPVHHAMSDHADQETLCLRAGDAVAIDYRLLHSTHANDTAVRRDCLMLTFAPSWSELPADVRGHLIRHPALPADGEAPPIGSWGGRLLPRYEGHRADLPLNRNAPPEFLVEA